MRSNLTFCKRHAFVLEMEITLKNNPSMVKVMGNTSGNGLHSRFPLTKPSNNTISKLLFLKEFFLKPCTWNRI